MPQRARILLLLCALLAATFAGARSARTDAGMAERILVTIRYDAIDAMHGDAIERYHRPHDYGAGASAEPVLNALATEYGIVRVSGWPMRSLAVHCEVYTIAPGTDVDAVVARLAQDARVDSAEPLRHFQTLTAPSPNLQTQSEAGNSRRPDSYRGLQHSLDELDVDGAHALSRGRGIRIAVIDSGIDSSHPDLNNAVSVRRDFTSAQPAAHGTEVAGVIAARGDGQGILGVAPEAQLLDLRACWGDGSSSGPASCDSFSLAQALDYAVTNAVDVINLSLAGPEDPLLSRLLKAAEARAICVVAAAAPGDSTSSGFPASVRSVIVVGMSDPTAHEPASARVRAPGTDVLTTFPGARYDYASGSSLAAAHVSGIVALARALYPRLRPQQVRTLLAAREHLSAASVLADATALR